tara:strand:- start:10518 stop:11135 length:618 start_codon:yes stop_codon:yes gene_type:complete
MDKLISVLLREALETFHSVGRFKNRFGKLNSGDITTNESVRIIKNLESLEKYDFPRAESFGVLLGEFKVKRINRNRDNDVKVVSGEYYSVKHNGKVSIGNQIWAIVRGNNIVTIMFRRSSQDGSERYLMDSLGVDKIIRVKNFSKYKETIDIKPIKKRKFKKIKIDGYGEVKYYEDNNEFITKDGTKLDISNIIDKLPDSIKNKV